MKKKKIIIGMLCAAIITGTIAGAVYALDLGVTSETEFPFAFESASDNAVLAKDDPSIEVELYLPETYMGGDDVFYYDYMEKEKEKEYLNGQKRVHKAVIDAKAELGVDVGINEYDCEGMTKEQIKTYVYLISQLSQSKKTGGIGMFPRIQAVALGNMPYNAERLTVEALDEIVKQSSNLDEIINKVWVKYGVPDYMDLSINVPSCIVDYFLDDYGDKRIAFRSWWDEKEIYIYSNESGEVEQLYSNEELEAIFAAEK